jgi:hypothetical protein
MNELYFERADLQQLLRRYRVELHLFRKVVLFQAPLHQRQRKRCAVHRNVQIRQKERHRPDMIFVAVSENERTNVLPVLAEVGEIGRHQIDA